MYLISGRFWVPKILTLTRLSAKLLMKMCFICMRTKNHFYTNGFALSLALKQRLGTSWKWPTVLTTVSPDTVRSTYLGMCILKLTKWSPLPMPFNLGMPRPESRSFWWDCVPGGILSSISPWIPGARIVPPRIACHKKHTSVREHNQQ